MKPKTDNLDFINYVMTMGRALDIIHKKISNSQQHEELTEQETLFLKEIHDKLYWPGTVVFDKKNMDAARLKVVTT